MKPKPRATEIAALLDRCHKLLGARLDDITIFVVFGALKAAATANQTAVVLAMESVCEGLESKQEKSVSNRQLSRSRAGARSSMALATQKAPCSSPENQR